MRKKRIAATLLVCTLTTGMFTGISQPVLAEEPAGKTGTTEEDLFYIEDSISYENYLEKYSDKSVAVSEIAIDCSKQEGNLEKTDIDGISGVYLPQDSVMEYTFSVPTGGIYNLKMLYYAVEAADTSIELDLKLDGEHPFREAAGLGLTRNWIYKDEIKVDSQGNEIRPDSVAIPKWTEQKLEYTAGKGGEVLEFHLEEGEHKLTLTAMQNPVVISEITFTVPEEVKGYADTLKQWEKEGYVDVEESLKLQQAEKVSGRSDKGIAIVNDRSSAATTPYHSYKVRYNSIGGSTWKNIGDWIEWEIEVPKTGLYTLALRFKQDQKTDDISTRTLTIDGKLPFEEAAEIAFPYSSSWQTTVVGDGETEYRFLLEEGKHTLRMTASLGETSVIINRAEEILEELNDIYLNLIMVTGTSPDMDRDYGLKKLLPEVFEDMEKVSKDLKSLTAEWKKLSDKNGVNTTFERLYDQLDRMVQDPEKVPKRLSQYQTNITSLSTWINSAKSQPLQLDYIMLTAPGTKAPKAEKNFFATLWHHLKQFVGSFKMDYSAVGSVETEAEDKITVWIMTGRDQADIISKMVNSKFTPEYGIAVEVQLVSAGALLPSTLAGIGPDICLGVGEADPVNYALRDAVVDLSTLEGADEIFSRFHEVALTPFELDNGVYALPETMQYPMLFYRKDILSELGITEQDLKDWDSIFQKVLPELQLSGFDFGFTTDVKNYASLLYQHGGRFYNDDKTAACLDETAAYTAFHMMTDMYTDYQIPLTFDFMNRFRSGQMPLAVTDYTIYNQLSVFAPEIEGMWGMTTLPGVIREDGTINNTAVCTTTGAVLLKNSENVEAAWTFLKWWTQGDVQSEYASELETVMGTAARYATANLEAMENVQWSYDIKKALKNQQENLLGMEQIAGSYYTARNFDFAFRAVVNNGENDREELLGANETINEEITEKRLEFYGEEQQGNE